MKASVQYNDFIGTSAADISDFTSLNNFLFERGVDAERYDAIGADFHTGYSDYFSASIICIDKKLSNEAKKHIVSIGFENSISKDDFFDLFKRFNVTILQRFGGYENLEIDQDISFDDREKE